jgi:ankyrin repeat protein
LNALQRCFPPNLRRVLNELPKTLDETYEEILKRIDEAQRDDTHRLLQCLTVAARPLQVDELAELLAFDFQAMGKQGIPTLREDWRWNDQEQAALSMCSSLVAIVRNGDSRVVQFSHFSVKEYLTSPRLAQSRGDVSRFYVDLNAAHTILAQACLGTLLRQDEHAGKNGSKGLPLVEYAAQHWVEHARFKDVSLRVRDGMDDLFDNSKPHFMAWLRTHDMDKRWGVFRSGGQDAIGSPLYYAAFCGFYDLAERLIMKHPEQVNLAGGLILAPLPAALSKRHFRVADLLCKHGAVVDVRDQDEWTPLHVSAAIPQSVDIMRWLLKRGANASAQTPSLWTPLHHAAFQANLEAVQVLLEYNPDISLRNTSGKTPLHGILTNFSPSPEGKVIETVRRLLEYGADPNIRCDGGSGSTPLHLASFGGSLEVTRLLLSYGANIDEKDGEGKTPFRLASSYGHNEIMRLLLEQGAVPP